MDLSYFSPLKIDINNNMQDKAYRKNLKRFWALPSGTTERSHATPVVENRGLL